jgi:hypothetical protein
MDDQPPLSESAGSTLYSLDLQTLIADLSEAAEAFQHADQGERMFAVMRSVSAFRKAFHHIPEVKSAMGPLIALIASIDRLVQGENDPLLSRIKKRHHPTKSGSRIIEQVAAVFAAEIFIRAGSSPSEADCDAAKLAGKFGVKGAKGGLVSPSTVGEWRLGARSGGHLPEVGKHVFQRLASADMMQVSAAELCRYVETEVCSILSVPGRKTG